MKKIYTLFMVSAIAMTTRAQLLINENFTGYTTGNLGTQGSWAQSGSGTDLQIKNTSPLLYSGYTSGAEYVSTTSVNGISSTKSFISGATVNTNHTNQFIYMSFVVRVSSIPASGNISVYSVALNSGNTNYPARFFIDRNAANSAIQFGVAVGSESPAYTGFNYSFNTTYLIVMRYDVVSGNNNDNAYLWVNPSSLSSEPTTASANASHVTGVNGYAGSGEVNYGNSLTSIKMFQNNPNYTPTADFDAFRAAYGSSSLIAWTNLSPQGATLPVTLTSFNASTDGLNNTKLVWNTSNESGIVSYVVEKSTDGRTFSDIGSVPATQQSAYSYTDNQATTDYIYYRLKMVENDGSFKYSYIVSLKSKLSLNISLSPNPVRSTLLIQHPKVGTEGHIEIINNGGQLIKDFRIPASAVMTSIDMSGLATGLYHVVFKNGTDVFSKMVLKQ